MKSKNLHAYSLISSKFRRFFSLAALVSVLILFPFVAHSAEVTLKWDPNNEDDLAGYKIYYRTPDGVYSPSDSFNVKTMEKWRNPDCGSPYNPKEDKCCEFTVDTVDTVDGLDPGTYYFAATAYDKDGNESAKSEELKHTFSNDEPIPPPTGSLKVTITPSAAVSAGAQWRVVGDTSWRNSGTTQSGLSVGSHPVEFEPITGWDKPGNATVNIIAGQTTTISRPYVDRRTGSLKVTITPSAAVSAGAQWRVVGDTSWRNSGTTQSGLSVGSHPVEFEPITGWDKPGNATVNIIAGQTTTISRPYVDRRTGSLKVTITPSAAVSAGAQWRVVGDTSWRNSGTTQSGLSVGSHPVEFEPITGWDKPGNATVNIIAGQTTTISRPYVDRRTGSLKVTITPSAAVSAGAQWRVVGDTSWRNSGTTQSGLSVGSHPVEFEPITGWDKPGNATVNIIAGQTTTASRPYVDRRTGSLKVTITPSAAVSAGAQWRVVGDTSWRNSGTTQSGLSVGSHPVEFEPITGWDKPGNATVNIIAGQTTTISGTYSPDNTLPTVTIEAEDMEFKTTGKAISGGWNIWGNGYIADDIDFAAGGTASFEVVAMGSYAGGAWPIMEVWIDQISVGTVTVDSSSWTEYTIQARITSGTHEVAIAFTNDYFKDPDDRNLYVDKVTITTENSAPVSDAGNDQTVEEGETVTLSDLNSTDPDDNIASYTWQQTDGTSVTLSNSKGAETTFTAPNALTDADKLTFRLTVKDAEGLQDIDDCIVTVTRVVVVDSGGDGIPDDQDAFPNEPEEYPDTDGDGDGDNALKDDAADDPDGDGDSNFDEYNLETDPNDNESNLAPHPPQLLNPGNDKIVGLTPLLETETDGFYDPDINDVHSQTRWKIIRAHDEFCVFDVTTDSSLTSLTVPKLILEYDTDYIWRVKFVDNYGASSDWSEAGNFTTEFSEQDSDGNGVLDHQEVDDTLDLDKDGVFDREQSDIKCIVADSGEVQIGVSIRDAGNIDSILSLEIEEFDDVSLLPNSKGKPNFIEFGLLHFSLRLNSPGEETVVTIYLNRAAFDKGKMYKYDPVNTQWLDYSEYAQFSRNRKTVYLTLKDGGFGDADGIENGIIVDPLAFGSESDPNSGSDFFAEDIAENLDPSGMCFISAADSRSADKQVLSFWSGIRSRELSMVFILMMLAYIGKEIFFRVKRYRRRDRKTSLMEGWRNS